MNQYKILPLLPGISELQALSETVMFKSSDSHRRRIGINKLNRLSVYYYSRYLTWNKTQRELFATAFGDTVSTASVVNWFLRFPAQTGFLDRLETWVSEKSPSWITAYVISDSGTIVLGDKILTLPYGKGITFPLSLPHEIPATANGSTWACAMTFDNVWNNND